MLELNVKQQQQKKKRRRRRGGGDCGSKKEKLNLLITRQLQSGNDKPTSVVSNTEETLFVVGPCVNRVAAIRPV